MSSLSNFSIRPSCLNFNQQKVTLSLHSRRTLAMCGYGTLQAPEFDEQDRLADAPVEKTKTVN
jgi:hypothetical protein